MACFCIASIEIENTCFSNRLRILRNLIEASGDEIRREVMPELLADVVQIIAHGDLQKVKAFNQVQVENELRKAEMLEAAPALKVEFAPTGGSRSVARWVDRI